ncbi:hypothetical protein LTR50_007880 [Elasticomyces elasticus]|nr:hypothetical protein LTR50_007880 [Elasticomyces elasticus]
MARNKKPSVSGASRTSASAASSNPAVVPTKNALVTEHAAATPLPGVTPDANVSSAIDPAIARGAATSLADYIVITDHATLDLVAKQLRANLESTVGSDVPKSSR